MFLDDLNIYVNIQSKSWPSVYFFPCFSLYSHDYTLNLPSPFLTSYISVSYSLANLIAVSLHSCCILQPYQDCQFSFPHWVSNTFGFVSFPISPISLLTIAINSTFFLSNFSLWWIQPIAFFHYILQLGNLDKETHNLKFIASYLSVVIRHWTYNQKLFYHTSFIYYFFNYLILLKFG